MRNVSNYEGIDFTGNRHCRLTAIKKADYGKTQWVCKCDCGNIVTLPICKFFEYKSCGCLEKENRKNLARHTRTHGMTETRLYGIWCGIKDRCNNPHYKYFHRYGGRGITVCDEWYNSFESFRDWAYENGYDPNLSGREQSIDRINTDGNYEPSNCKWSNQKEQVHNRSNSVHMIYNGEDMSPYEFAEKHNITNKVFIYRRLEKGDSPEKILHDWKMINETPDNYMTPRDAANHYGVCVETINIWIKKGWLKREKVGSRNFIPINQTVKKQ